MEKRYGRRKFFYAKAVEGIDAVLNECRWRFKRVFDTERTTQRPTPRFDAFNYLNKIQQNYDEWEEVVTESKRERLCHYTTIEFFAKLEREIERMEREQKRNEELKRKFKH